MRRSTALVILAFSVLAPGVAAQATLQVPSQFATIQAAIAAAAPGDTVLVGPGHYVETLTTLGKAITITSLQGAAATTVDAGGQGPALAVLAGEGPQTVIAGFRFTGGIGFLIPTPAGPVRAGGGVYVSNSSPTIRDCIIAGNVATRGGGIDCSGSVFFQRCLIENNQAGQFGGGATVLPGGMAIFENCRFLRNTALVSGGGLWFETANAAALVGCLVAENVVPGPSLRGLPKSGGGIFLRNGGSLLVASCTITNNGSPRDGGIASDGSLAQVTILNSIVWHNSGQDLVGATGTPSVSHSAIEGGAVGVGNVAAAPLFVDLLGGDYHLSPASRLVDAATAATTFLPAIDVDGDPRSYFGAPDIGCDEVTDVAAARALAGSVGAPLPPGERVLLVNGSDGGENRRVHQAVGENNSFTLLLPAASVAPVDFAIFGFLAEPTPADFVTLPLGIGEMAFTPSVLIPWAYPLVFTVTHSLGTIGGTLVGSSPAPWVSPPLGGLPIPMNLSFQAVVEESPGQLRASNCVILVIG